MSLNKIRVLISDPMPLFREGIKAHLAQYDDIEVIGECNDNVEALEITNRERPDVIVADLADTGSSSSDILPLLCANEANSRVLVMSITSASIDVQFALSEGASGFILKNANSAEFVDAIRVISRSGSYLPASLMNRLVEAASRTRSSGNMFGLTAREMDILKQLSVGFCNKEIARLFNISVRTVETHRQNIRQKTNTFTTADLMRVAGRLGLNQNSSNAGVNHV